jgi:hypothetical protein
VARALALVLAPAMTLAGCWADGPPEPSSLSQVGATGPVDLAGSERPPAVPAVAAPQSLVATAGAANIFFNRNFSNVALAAFPGVTVASLTLPPGAYTISAKFRYRGAGTAPSQAACVYQSALGSIGGLDASQNSGTLTTGTVDGYLMDIFINNTAADAEVHVQCFGPAQVTILNPQFAAVSAAFTFQP